MDRWAVGASTSSVSASDGGGDLSIAVLDRFGLFDSGARVALPGGSERLLAFLALADRSVKRLVVATALWPETSEPHAYGNLRSALSRLGFLGRTSVRVGALEVGLAEGVHVDIHEARAMAHRLVDPGMRPCESDLSVAAAGVLSCELLPGWYDDWAILEAEDWRQLRLHALEALAGHLSGRGRFGVAGIAARAAVRAEPLRESARVALVRVHLAEGNRAEAVREFERYCKLLRAEFGVEPTDRLRQLLRG